MTKKQYAKKTLVKSGITKPKSKNKQLKHKLHIRLWEVMKEYIRLRDRNTCQHCKKIVFGCNSHPSHVYSKKAYPTLKYDELNIKIMCMCCHRWWHLNPIEASEWFNENFPERLEYLLEAKNKYVKCNEAFLEDKIHYYKDKISDHNVGIDIREE